MKEYYFFSLRRIDVFIRPLTCSTDFVPAFVFFKTPPNVRGKFMYLESVLVIGLSPVVLHYLLQIVERYGIKNCKSIGPHLHDPYLVKRPLNTCSLISFLLLAIFFLSQ